MIMRDGADSGAGYLLMRPEPVEGQPTVRLRQAQAAVNGHRLRSRPGEGLRLTAWLPFPADGRRPCWNSI